MNIVATAVAKGIVRHYVCAKCYGELTFALLPDHACKIYCHKCGDEAGIVSREYAWALQANSAWERREVDDLLEKLGILPARPKQSTDEILKDLGY